MAETVLVRDGDTDDVAAMAWADYEDLRAGWHQQALRVVAGEVCFLVAVTDGLVVGKAVVDWTHNSDGSAWLWMFSVHPDFRSRGIGRQLLATAEARATAHGCTAIEMGVDDDDERARDLYLSQGFEAIGPYLDEFEYTGTGGRIVQASSVGVWVRKFV